MDCSDGALYCAPCTVSNHIRQCLHRIQVSIAVLYINIFPNHPNLVPDRRGMDSISTTSTH